MRVFCWEYACATAATGTVSAAGETVPVALLWPEGRAMLAAVLADFAAVPGLEAWTVLPAGADASWLPPGVKVEWCDPAEEPAAFRHVASWADWSLLIAPEFDERVLSGRCRWVEEVGGRLLGLPAEVTRTLSNKLAYSNYINGYGRIPPINPTTYSGVFFSFGLSLRTTVVKPRLGAGCVGVRLWQPGQRWPDEWTRNDGLVEQLYCPGQAASVSWLTGPLSPQPLAPCRQLVRLGTADSEYLGGSVPLLGIEAERAVALTRPLVEYLKKFRGYIGFDIVLGDDPSGEQDAVIEINPRLTTSYIGLRRLAAFNIAEAMLKIAAGQEVGPLTWKPGRVEFDPDGTVREFPAG
jgi:predicted ATP-grasp superfamily ATP-dependent carboligase